MRKSYTKKSRRVYEDLRMGAKDPYGAIIRQPMTPRTAFQRVMDDLRQGNYGAFGIRQLVWDVSDPRNDEEQGLHICEIVLRERMEEDEKENKGKKF